MDGRADYIYATFLKNADDLPEYEQANGRSLDTYGSNNQYDYTLTRVLKGGSEYYLCVGYRNSLLSASTWGYGYYTGSKYCAINNIQIYGINVEKTEMEINGGRIEATGESKTYSICAI